MYIQYTRVKWDTQGIEEIGPTQRMSHICEDSYKWDLDKRREIVPVNESLSTSLSILYLSVIDQVASFLLLPICDIMNVQLQNVYKLRKNLLYLFFVFKSFSMQCPHIESLFTFYFGKHCIEVPLKRSFFARGTEKMIPVSESPSYPGSHLCEVFLLRKGDKMRGPRKTVLLSKSPSYPGSHLTRVYCTLVYLHH